MASSTKEVCTFVFLDLEASGLADKPRITELSLIAVHRISLTGQCNNYTPRVINKLTVCVDPEKPISFQASGLTGLYNDALSLHPPFNENVADMLEVFFKQLPSPICVLAHNGKKYDFPLLVAELLRVGRKLPEGLLCADTLEGFREILSMDQVKQYIASTSSRPNPANFFSPKPGPSGENGTGAQKRMTKTIPRKKNGPSDITPEMQAVKSSGFGNAPKKKPVVEELPKEERVTAARRKLNFGSVSPVAGHMAVDDVDVEDVLVSLSGGFRVTPNNSFGSPDSQDAVANNPDSQATIPFTHSLSQRDSQDTEEDIPDHILLNAVEKMEMSAEQTSGHQQVSSNSPFSSQMKSWAQVLKSDSSTADVRDRQTVTDQNQNLTLNLKTKTAPKTPPNSSTLEADSNTTPQTGQKQFLDSFPTPSPSPHKSPDVENDAWPMLVSPSTSACPSPNSYTAKGGRKGSNLVGFSLALASVHRQVVGFDPINAHSAEDDCMSLLRIAQKLSPWFCTWVDAHSLEFSSIDALYNSSKRPKKH